MYSGQLGKDRPDVAFLFCRNAEASSDIVIGSPVCFVMNGTNDGNDVVLPGTGAAGKATSLFAGVISNVGGLANGKYGVAQVFGLCQKNVLVQRTRAATTDSWSSVASIPAGNLCQIDTVNNAFGTNAAGAASNFLGFAMVAESQASIAGSATSTSNALTVQTSTIKLFLRSM